MSPGRFGIGMACYENGMVYHFGGNGGIHNTNMSSILVYHFAGMEAYKWLT